MCENLKWIDWVVFELWVWQTDRQTEWKGMPSMLLGEPQGHWRELNLKGQRIYLHAEHHRRNAFLQRNLKGNTNKKPIWLTWKNLVFTKTKRLLFRLVLNLAYVHRYHVRTCSNWQLVKIWSFKFFLNFITFCQIFEPIRTSRLLVRSPRSTYQKKGLFSQNLGI